MKDYIILKMYDILMLVLVNIIEYPLFQLVLSVISNQNAYFYDVKKNPSSVHFNYPFIAKLHGQYNEK